MPDDFTYYYTHGSTSFAKAIHGHKMITGFAAGDASFRLFDIMCSRLANASAFVSVLFNFVTPRSGTKFMSKWSSCQLPVREVQFERVDFTCAPSCEAFSHSL
jgi:hypothetical protein